MAVGGKISKHAYLMFLSLVRDMKDMWAVTMG